MSEDAERRRGERPRCLAIVQPGEYMIDIWDGKRCEEKNPRMLTTCEGCKARYCYMHYHIHLSSVPMDHFEKATSL